MIIQKDFDLYISNRFTKDLLHSKNLKTQSINQIKEFDMNFEVESYKFLYPLYNIDIVYQIHPSFEK